MFLDILKFALKTKQKNVEEKLFGKCGLWFKEKLLCVHKTTLRKKVQKIKRIKTKNNENV